MFTLKNTAFDATFKKFNVKRIEELSTTQLSDLAKEVHEEVLWIKDANGRRLQINRLETVKLLKDQFRFSDYLPESYWTEEQRSLLNEANYNEAMKKHSTGTETYQFFQTYQLGVSDLQPGDSRNVDYTPEYVKEVLLERPIVKQGIIEVYDESGKRLTLEKKEEAGSSARPLTLDDQLMEMKKTDLYLRAKQYRSNLKAILSRQDYIDIILANEHEPTTKQ